MKVKVELSSKDKKALKITMEKLRKSNPKALMDELHWAGLNIETKAKLITPVLDNRLRPATTTVRHKDSVTVSNNVEYAPDIEFGTKYQKAQPFMRPSFRRGVKELLAKLKHMVK